MTEVLTDTERVPTPVGAAVDIDDEAIEPWWLVAGLLAALSGLAVAGIVGLALAIAAVFDVVLVAVIGVPIWLGLIALGWPLVRHARTRPTSRHAAAATLCVLVFLVAWVAWNVPRTGQHVIIERDPGAYTNAARWIAQDGSLEVDVSGPPFAGQPDLVFGSAAIYQMPSGVLQFQFAHFEPVVLAEAHGIGGDRLMFRTSLLMSALALLALYALALRVLHRPWLAAVPVVALGVSIPQLWFSRDTFSEIPMQALLLGGLWLLALSRRSERLGPAVVTGVVFGAMIATRIDTPILLIAPIVVIGVEWLGVPRGDRRVAKLASGFAIGAVVPITVGLVDLTSRSGYYDEALADKNRAVWAVAGLSLVGFATIIAFRDRFPRLRTWVADRRDGLGTAAAVATGAVLVFLWGPRRFVSTPSRSKGNDTMRSIERREGLTPTGTRHYAEQSVEWLRWHMGIVALVLGIIGAMIVASELVRRRRRDVLGLFVAFCTGGVLYLWRPTIFPDHPWAMRRFLPVLLPAMFVFGAITISWVVGWLNRRSSRIVTVALGSALALGIVVPTAIGTWPVREMRAQANYVKPVLWICEEVGSDGAIVLLPTPDYMQKKLPQAFRSWCDVPVAVATVPLTPERTQELARAADAAGRELYLVAAEGEPLEQAGARNIRPSPTGTNPYGLQSTLTRRPDTLRTGLLTVALGKA